MRILLTNDDGVYAAGILAMYDALARRHEVQVVAPERVQSGGSHAITIRHPVLWRDVVVAQRMKGTSVEGTPADCVKLALGALLAARPDVVVSGINDGLNTGIHAFYSGTVAAALEAGILGVPAFAVSLQMSAEMNYRRAAEIAAGLIERMAARGLRSGQVFNVNIPELRPGWPRGLRPAPMSTEPVDDVIEQRSDPQGRRYYWLSGNFESAGAQEGTDRRLVREGYVGLTPLQFDLTNSRLLDEIRRWDLNLGDGAS